MKKSFALSAAARVALAALAAAALVFIGCFDSPDFSDFIDPPPSSPALTGTVSIGTGAPASYTTVTANTTGLNGTGALSYVWELSAGGSAPFTAITGQTGASYTILGADATKHIRVVVSRAGYIGSIASNVLGPITADPTTAAATLKNKLVAAGITGATVSGSVVTITGTASLDIASYDGGDDIDVKPGVTLKIASGATLTLTGTPGSSPDLYLYGGGTLTVDGTLVVSADILRPYSTDANDATINGTGTIKLAAASYYHLLNVDDEQVTLTDVTLEGLTTNFCPLVYVDGGSLTMTGAAKITGNTAMDGGGVHVRSGTFTMNGSASVVGNTAKYGGGVLIGENGTFTMNGGASVVGNAATLAGGGVLIGEKWHVHHERQHLRGRQCR